MKQKLCKKLVIVHPNMSLNYATNTDSLIPALNIDGMLVKKLKLAVFITCLLCLHLILLYKYYIYLSFENVTVYSQSIVTIRLL